MESVTQQSMPGSQKEINISYETLFEILRVEKNRDDLQGMPTSFFEEVLAYLREKQQILDESKAKGDLFSATERDKIATEMGNIRKIIRELYERREKKIVNMALNKSRTKSNIIDTSKLLKEENVMFGNIVSTLDRFREGVLVNVLDFREPFVEEKTEKHAVAIQKPAEGNGSQQKATKLVRFLNPIPKFLGKELEVYGPFDEEDMASLPSEIADILIGKGRAEEITSN